MYIAGHGSENATFKTVIIQGLSRASVRPSFALDDPSRWPAVFNDGMAVIAASYHLWRKAVLAAAGSLCGLCGTHEEHLIAHHKKRYRDFESLRLDTDNGMALCHKCHISLHRNDGPRRH